MKMIILKCYHAFISIFLICIYIRHSFQQDCVHPINYSDFTLLLIDDSIIATGGNSEAIEVWTLNVANNITRNCWTLIQNSVINSNYSSYKNGVGFKASNSSFAVQAGDNSTNTMLNITLFNTITKTWSTPALNGISPSPRSRMSVAVNETTNIAWYYGGRNEISAQSANYFNSFYNFDINTYTWNWPTTSYSGGQRPARYGHCSNLISERLFIIGGKTAVYSNDSNSWIVSTGDFQSVLIYDTSSHQSISMAALGNIPPARYSFTTVNAPDGKSIVLFGGQNATLDNKFDATNDIYILDTCTLNWTKPVIKGTPPVARAGHEAIVYQNRYMIVAMGIQNYIDSIGPVYINDIAILDMKSWEWVTDISLNNNNEDNSLIAANHCRFTFPVVISNDGNGNGNLDTTIISDINKSSTIKKLALGITFGVLGLALFIFIIILLLRRNIIPLPSVIKRKRYQYHENLPSTTSSVI